MPTTGEKLRRERENRGVAIEEIAERTGVDRSHFESLERDDFPALPGRAFGKFFIRLYGEVLGFDPQTLIAEYDRAYPIPRDPEVEPARPDGAESYRVETAIHAWRESLRADREARADAVEGTPATPLDRQGETAPDRKVTPEVETLEATPERIVEEPPVPSRRLRGALAWTLLAAALLSVVLWIYLTISGGRGENVVDPQTNSPILKDAPEIAAAEPPESPSIDLPPTPPPSVPTIAPRPEPPGSLTVPESGVGRRVVQHRLVGPGDRFESGTVVWFLTRVVGGRRGDIVRHVWIQGNRSAQSVDLRLGSSDWRTFSRLRVRGKGPWTVEARDAAGRVLARETFECE